jgi:hypothetical protein
VIRCCHDDGDDDEHDDTNQALKEKEDDEITTMSTRERTAIFCDSLSVFVLCFSLFLGSFSRSEND